MGLRSATAPDTCPCVLYCWYDECPLSLEGRPRFAVTNKLGIVGALHETILVANKLGFKHLLNVTCMCVADMIKGKTPQEIRTTFNIKNDFTLVRCRRV